jgi:hypothetical protein
LLVGADRCWSPCTCTNSKTVGRFRVRRI